MTRDESGIRIYALTWLGLVLLALASVLLTREAAHGWANTLALVIAAIKALLIALFFMHLSRGRVSVRLGALAALALLGVLSSLTVADVLTRASPLGISSER